MATAARSERMSERWRSQAVRSWVQHAIGSSSRRGPRESQGFAPDSEAPDALGGGGVVFSMGGFSRRHLSSAGCRAAMSGGTRGTTHDRNSETRPVDLSVEHAQPYEERAPFDVLVKHASPLSAHHMRESWLLFRLSPITQTSPGFAENGPWYSGKPPVARS